MKKIIALLFLLVTLNAQASVPFDGATSGGDRLSCGTGDIWQEDQPVTLMIEYNMTSQGPSNSGRFISRANATGCNLLNQASGAIQYFCTGGTQMTRNSGTSFVSTGTRQILFVTWDGSTTAANVKFYVNGVEEDSYGTTTNGATLADNSAQTLLIGNRSAFDRTFDGIIYRVAIWNVVLTSAEMEQIRVSNSMLMPLQIKRSNLSRYWMLNDEPDGSSGDADTFLDYSGNGGTCTGDDGTNNTGLTVNAVDRNSY